MPQYKFGNKYLGDSLFCDIDYGKLKTFAFSPNFTCFSDEYSDKLIF